MNTEKLERANILAKSLIPKVFVGFQNATQSLKLSLISFFLKQNISFKKNLMSFSN